MSKLSPVTESGRHLFGPRPVSALVPVITRAAFRRRAPAFSQVMLDWEIIMGPRLASGTRPRALKSGVLTIICASPEALELQHFAPDLIARINAHVGHSIVQRLRFVHGVVARPVPASGPSQPPPHVVAAIESKVGEFAAGPLRDALTALGLALLSSSPE